MGEIPKTFPPQRQARQPGHELRMAPRPIFIREGYRGSGKLNGKVALITGGDSGIGRAVAVHFAREGADLVLVYLSEHDDARATLGLVEAEGRRCLLMPGDLTDEAFCRAAVAKTVRELRKLDILVNNAAEQHVEEDFATISATQLRQTFATNFFAYFLLAQAALEHLGEGATIINTASETAYRGSDHLIDYTATKGAIVSFTRSLAKKLVERGIRVNGVSPGPIWTPLIPASFPPDRIPGFGRKTLMGRAGQPAEVAPAFIFLASADASYMTGQLLHAGGGDFLAS